ncbi:DUF742 domain-containing protein [Streptomyces sp. NBRC 110028]|uniref:DUF742 domain-containing protein n=1 Tax=Streptomyces sp. NBRC 110028 TaxID=1621260 RepID=UPI002277792E|nr:DUF742 domain-containing protein [Streptomyces sp. NBRC 110028]
MTSDGQDETSEGTDDANWYTAEDRNFVRPFAMTGGRAAPPRYALPIETVVRTTADASHIAGLLPEHQRICHLCREPHDISQVADQLSLPLGVARILVADLLEAGLVAVQSDAVLASLDKGGSIELTPEASGITLSVGLGWEVPDCNGTDFDLDAAAIGAKEGQVYSDQYFVFFNNLRAPDNSIVHTGNEAGVDGDKETILPKNQDHSHTTTKPQTNQPNNQTEHATRPRPSHQKHNPTPAPNPNRKTKHQTRTATPPEHHCPVTAALVELGVEWA